MFQSPQRGDNSKGSIATGTGSLAVGFSPRNGEIILKDVQIITEYFFELSFSPRNGEIILKDCPYRVQYDEQGNFMFQSPQWGDNSKAVDYKRTKN